MFSDEELDKMMNGEPIDSPNSEPAEEIPAEPAEVESVDPDTEPAEVETDASPSDGTTVNKMTVEDSVTVSEIILGNADKYTKMTLVNSNIQSANQNCDLTNYIVYVNTDKKIPCIYDCKGLRIPKASVKNDDGTWKVTSVEGRRSGFVIKCGSERDLVMTKNFIYDCTLDANGNITSVKKYDRKNTITDVTETSTSEYDVATIYVQKVLPKIVKSGKYTTIDALREQVKIAYNKVDDVNGLFKIVNLRLQIGC